MSLSATYLGDLSRVALSATTWGATVTYVVVDRFDTAVLTNPETVRGGAHIPISTGDTLLLDDYEFTPGVENTYRVRAYNASNVEVPTYSYTATVTPVLTEVWLKSIARPFLNQPVQVVDFSEVELPARGATFEILGRRAPIAVTDVRGSRRFVLVLRAQSILDADAIELALSFGDVMLIHVPDDAPLPRSVYAQIGNVSIARAGSRHDTQQRYITIPVTEVAAPAAALVGSTATYGGLAVAFGTYADLTAAFATYLDLAQYVAAPDDEVVG